MSAIDRTPNSRTSRRGPRLVKPVTKTAVTRNIPWKMVAVYFALAAAFFSMGFIPGWLKARQSAAERETAQHQLRLKQMESQIAAAVINADRGEYEPARQTASDFFTALRTQLDRGDNSDLSAPQRDKVKGLLSQRDDVITLLARSDPAAVNRLSDIYVTYQKAMNDVGSHTLDDRHFDGDAGGVRLVMR